MRVADGGDRGEGDREEAALHGVHAALAKDESLDVGRKFTELVAEYLSRAYEGEGRVSTDSAPDELAERFSGPMPESGEPLEALLRRLQRDVLSDCNRLAHPMAMGHQVSAPLPLAVWVEQVIAALNQSVAVAEMSPTGTMVEMQLVRWLAELAGLGPKAGGTLTSGGTEATFTALLAARAAALPDAWRDGVGAEPPVVLHGEHSHYAVTRAVAQLGLGLRRAIAIPSRDYRMDPGALESALDRLTRGGTPVMAVVATAASTATGSFDDLEAIGALCEARGVWLHVDAAHGGSALFSARHRARLRGLERARSIAWDPHKMMLLPLSAGMLLVRDERELERAFVQSAPYLFHGSAGARAWDQGTRSFMCSRRLDALKVWAVLHRYGSAGMGALYDGLCATTQALYEAVSSRGDFEAPHAPESNILCFRYRGSSSAADPALDALNLDIRTRYNRSGAGWITTTVLDGRRMLRTTIMNPRTTPAHAYAMLDGVAALAERAESA